MGKLTTANSRTPGSVGMKKGDKCRFCGRSHALAYARHNHEQHCKDNPERGYAIDGIVFNKEGVNDELPSKSY